MDTRWKYKLCPEGWRWIWGSEDGRIERQNRDGRDGTWWPSRGFGWSRIQKCAIVTGTKVVAGAREIKEIWAAEGPLICHTCQGASAKSIPMTWLLFVNVPQGDLKVAYSLCQCQPEVCSRHLLNSLWSKSWDHSGKNRINDLDLEKWSPMRLYR
jgi:hypothetical protein